jgi:hypothetical protein
VQEEDELIDLASRVRTIVEEIDRALAKFDAGSYGVGESSQRPIPVERLRAITWARFTRCGSTKRSGARGSSTNRVPAPPRLGRKVTAVSSEVVAREEPASLVKIQQGSTNGRKNRKEISLVDR